MTDKRKALITFIFPQHINVSKTTFPHSQYLEALYTLSVDADADRSCATVNAFCPINSNSHAAVYGRGAKPSR